MTTATLAQPLAAATVPAPRNRILAVLATFRRELLVIGVLSAIINLLMLSPTLYMLQVFDRVMISRSEFTLFALTAVVVFLYGVQGLCEWLRSRIIIGSGIRLDAVLNEPVFRATFRDQLRHSGRAPVQAFSDLTVIRQWLTSQGVFAFFDLPWAPIYLAVMFMLHPLLGLLTIFFMVVLAGFAWWTTVATREANDQAEEEERELNAFIHTKLRNAEVVEAHGMVPNLLKRWWLRQIDTLSRQARSHELEERFSVSSKQIRVLFQSLALGAGALLAIDGQISFGAMIAASLLTGRATAPIDQIVGGWKGFSNARKSLQRVEALLAAADTGVPDAPLDAPGAALRLRNVVATASGRAEPILKGIDADFEPGRIYAVLGNSGAGKSTLGKVLLGIWPQVQGDVLLNGQPVAQLDRALLGPRLGYLPQEIELFGGTVGENIARMAPEPDSAKVVEAARLTGTHDLILRLPRGYDTPIGEGGSQLSGGQRQRVALARALYGDPQLIVLDEPNANLDEVGEAALATALSTMRDRGATVFLITHRPGIVQVADQIIIMEQGRIATMGDRASVKAWMAARTQADAPIAPPVPQTPSESDGPPSAAN